MVDNLYRHLLAVLAVTSSDTVLLCKCSWFPGIIYQQNSTIGLNHCDFCPCRCMHYLYIPKPSCRDPLDPYGCPLDILWTFSGHPLDIFWTSFQFPRDVICIFFSSKKAMLMLFFHSHSSTM